MHARVLAVATLAALIPLATLVTGCPRSESTTTTPPVPAALTREDRLQIARLEAQRDAGVPRLIELTHDRHAGRRALALRGLGRVGSPDAVPI